MFPPSPESQLCAVSELDPLMREADSNRTHTKRTETETGDREENEPRGKDGKLQLDRL